MFPSLTSASSAELREEKQTALAQAALGHASVGRVDAEVSSASYSQAAWAVSSGTLDYCSQSPMKPSSKALLGS